MARNDFLHLTLWAEHASVHDAARHRWVVAGLASLARVFLLACSCVAFALVWVAASGAGLSAIEHTPMLRGVAWAIRAFVALGAVWLAWGVWQTLRCVRAQPFGGAIVHKDAPQLFEALARIRKRTGGPQLNAVRLGNGMEVRLVQTRSIALLGPPQNHLVVGLPLMLALDKPRFFTLMAHELAHLRTKPDALPAWVHLAHQELTDVAAQLQLTRIPSLARWFFKWLAPRFESLSLPMRRINHQQADEVAAHLISTDVAAAALMEAEVKAHWMTACFWPTHWHQAIDGSVPLGPHAELAAKFGQAIDPAFIHQSLQKLWHTAHEPGRAKPSLRERVAAIDVDRAVPELLVDWSQQPALRVLVKPKAWLDAFDAQWRKSHQEAWKETHTYFCRVKVRVHEIRSLRERANPSECVELANLLVRLKPDEPVRDLLEYAMKASPEHPGAMMAMTRRVGELSAYERFGWLARLSEASAARRWWAAQQAVQMLETDASLAAAMPSQLKNWKIKLKHATDIEGRIVEELHEGDLALQASRHDLNDFELSELRLALLCHSAICQAWIARKNLREYPWRRAYALVVMTQGLSEECGANLVSTMEQTFDAPGPIRVQHMAIGARVTPSLPAAFECVLMAMPVATP